VHIDVMAPQPLLTLAFLHSIHPSLGADRRRQRGGRRRAAGIRR
jgi:hypothetical protein